ncbi:hypothetical protein GGD83_004947 [Rhodoblastus sphagnicola]|nr:hypothetical protein [Rhodoblastus sphagnicola]MBB4201109.1 hypothetical protein [Rhodoblastus sphagnicola]
MTEIRIALVALIDMKLKALFPTESTRLAWLINTSKAAIFS